MSLSRVEPKLGEDLSNINLGDISHSPKYGRTGDTVTIDIEIENNSYLGTKGHPRINFYKAGKKFNSIDLNERDLQASSKRTWSYQYTISDYDVEFEVEAVEAEKIGTDIDDRRGMFSINYLSKDEPTPGKGTWKDYMAPVGLGSAVGFGAAEVYEEPSLPIVVLGAGSGAALKYAGSAFSESLQKMNLPTWSIWGVSLGVIGSGIVLGQFTELLGG